MADESSTSTSGDRWFGACYESLFGLFFLLFLLGAVFGPFEPDATVGDYIALWMVTGLLGGLAVGGIATAANRAWGERITTRILSFVAIALQCLFVRGTIQQPTPDKILHIVGYYMLAVWIGFALLGYFQARPRVAYSEIVLWPLGLFFAGGIAGILLVALFAGFIAAGAAIGGTFAHAHLGGAIGFAAFTTSAYLLARRGDVD